MSATIRDIAAAINRRLDAMASRGDIAKNVAAYLLAQRRVRDLDAVLRELMRQRTDDGIVEVNVTTARPLDAALRSKVEALVQEREPNVREIIINETVDPSLVGGVVISTDRYELDASVRGKLVRLKQVSSLKGMN
jgi:F-type H+-transporting ATPase subunit delta